MTKPFSTCHKFDLDCVFKVIMSKLQLWSHNSIQTYQLGTLSIKNTYWGSAVHLSKFLIQRLKAKVSRWPDMGKMQFWSHMYSTKEASESQCVT